MENVDSDLMKEMLVWLRIENRYQRDMGVHLGRMNVLSIGGLLTSIVTVFVSWGDVAGYLGVVGIVFFGWVCASLMITIRRVGKVVNKFQGVWLGVLSGRLRTVEEVRERLREKIPELREKLSGRYG